MSGVAEPRSERAVRKVLLTADAVGGVWTYALELARGLAGGGVSVALATFGPEPSDAQRAEAEAIPGLSLHVGRFALEWMEDAWPEVEEGGRWLLDLARRVAPDVVHSNGYAYGALPFGRPTLVVGHSCVASWFEAVKGEDLPPSWACYRQEVARGLRAADRVVAPTAAMLRALERHYGPLPASEVIPNGRSVEGLVPKAKLPLILSAGRIWDEAKNVSALIEAAPRLSWPVRVAGSITSPSGEAKGLSGLASGKVELLGPLAFPELARWMGKAAIFALPARYEPFGLTAVEAALAGCALVLGDLASLREVWGDAAWYVPPDDARALGIALEALSQDEGTRRDLAGRANRRARELTSERMAQRYLALYEELARGVGQADSESGSPPAVHPGHIAQPPSYSEGNGQHPVHPERSPKGEVEGSGNPRDRDPPSHSALHRPTRSVDPSTPALRAYAQGERARPAAGTGTRGPGPTRGPATGGSATRPGKIVLFCHSLLSDWNHGNAHFLRGVVTELCARGHAVEVYEPTDAWSIQNLIADHGETVLDRAREAYPRIRPIRYERGRLDLDRVLDGARLVWVHEWNDPELVAALGEARASHDFRLLFHDTHHRIASDPEAIRRFDLRHYDGVLAFGDVIRRAYLERGWAKDAWTWHEAADAERFRPHPEIEPRWDVVWIGNWGDDERTDELNEFLLDPVRKLGLAAKVYGVRYPPSARAALARSGITFGGWLPNFEVPHALAEARVTLHVPRRPYVETLPGVPTIRVFEALACGTPLICAPWQDAEGLFHPGRDYLVAHTGAEMERLLKSLLSDAGLRRNLSEHGRQTVLGRHTCAHRTDQLLEIERTLAASTGPSAGGLTP